MLTQAERLNLMCAVHTPAPSDVPPDYVPTRAYNRNWKDDVQKFLRLHPHSSVKQIAEGLGVSQPTLSSKMSALYTAGVLARDKPGGTFLYRVKGRVK